jgi:diacylglycerol kinase family enzyme
LKTSTLIYNPIAGRHPARRERQIQQVADVLRRAGMEVQLAPTSRPGEAEELARAAAGQGVDLVLVCGGDGTINEVINGLAPSRIPLGILPGGTANILGKELRLPHDPVRAAAELPRWSPRRIGLGQATWQPRVPSQAKGTSSNQQVLGRPAAQSPVRVGGRFEHPGLRAAGRRYFVSVAGIGFDAHIVYKLSSELKMSWGVAGYVLEAFRQVVRYPFPAFTCQMDGRECRATFAVVHRTRLYAGWLHLAPSADLFEPRFAVCYFQSGRWPRYLVYAGVVLMRQHLRLSDVELVEARKVSCAAVEPGITIHFELDGELVGTLPATLEIVPDALTLLVPPSQAGN